MQRAVFHPKSEIAKAIAYVRKRWIALIRYIVASVWNAELHHIHLTAPQAMKMQWGCRCDHGIFGSAAALGLSEKGFLRQRRLY